MSLFDDPFDPDSEADACSCGHAHEKSCQTPVSEKRCQTPISADTEKRCQTPISPGLADDSDGRITRVVENALMRALFPHSPTRRAFLRAVGGSTAAAALSQVLPVGLIGEALADTGPLEKTKLAVGFIPITCATPIIMAKLMGFYERHGLDVDVVKTAGWAVVRDKTLNGEYDAAHMLSPMPIAITMGAGSNPIPYTMPAVENI